MKLFLEFLKSKVEDKPIKKINVAGGCILRKGPEGKNQVLLIQRSSDDHFPLHFEFPRGKCDKGDSDDIIKCLKREVKEETGLDIIPIKFVDKFKYVADHGKRESTQFNFLCKLKNPNQQIKLSKEHQDYRWVDSVGEIELLCLPEIKKTISRVLNTDSEIVFYPETEDVIKETQNIWKGYYN